MYCVFMTALLSNGNTKDYLYYTTVYSIAYHLAQSKKINGNIIP